MEPAQPGDRAGGGAGEEVDQPVPVLGTQDIQKMLEENSMLIQAIVENQNAGRLNECTQYQQKLQSNLMRLAALADSQAGGSQRGAGT